MSKITKNFKTKSQRGLRAHCGFDAGGMVSPVNYPPNQAGQAGYAEGGTVPDISAKMCQEYGVCGTPKPVPTPPPAPTPVPTPTPVPKGGSILGRLRAYATGNREYADGGTVPDISAKVCQEYGVCGTPKPAPTPPPAPAPTPTPAPAQNRGASILGRLRAYATGNREYAHGGAVGVDERGFIQGPGGVDNVPARVDESGEEIRVGAGERIVNRPQNAALERLAAAHGVELDQYLESATGKPVGPSVKRGLRAAADGLSPGDAPPPLPADNAPSMRERLTSRVKDVADAARGRPTGGAPLTPTPPGEVPPTPPKSVPKWYAPSAGASAVGRLAYGLAKPMVGLSLLQGGVEGGLKTGERSAPDIAARGGFASSYAKDGWPIIAGVGQAIGDGWGRTYAAATGGYNPDTGKRESLWGALTSSDNAPSIADNIRKNMGDSPKSEQPAGQAAAGNPALSSVIAANAPNSDQRARSEKLFARAPASGGGTSPGYPAQGLDGEPVNAPFDPRQTLRSRAMPPPGYGVVKTPAGNAITITPRKPTDEAPANGLDVGNSRATLATIQRLSHSNNLDDNRMASVLARHYMPQQMETERSRYSVDASKGFKRLEEARAEDANSRANREEYAKKLESTFVKDDGKGGSIPDKDAISDFMRLADSTAAARLAGAAPGSREAARWAHELSGKSRSAADLDDADKAELLRLYNMKQRHKAASGSWPWDAGKIDTNDLHDYSEVIRHGDMVEFPRLSKKAGKKITAQAKDFAYAEGPIPVLGTQLGKTPTDQYLQGAR